MLSACYSLSTISFILFCFLLSDILYIQRRDKWIFFLTFAYQVTMKSEEIVYDHPNLQFHHQRYAVRHLYERVLAVCSIITNGPIFFYFKLSNWWIGYFWWNERCCIIMRFCLKKKHIGVDVVLVMDLFKWICCRISFNRREFCGEIADLQYFSAIAEIWSRCSRLPQQAKF